MTRKKIRIAFDRALTGLASLTTHGASSSTYLSACIARSADKDILEQRQAYAADTIAAKRLSSVRQAASR